MLFAVLGVVAWAAIPYGFNKQGKHLDNFGKYQ